jgi:hypothetical protein
LAVIEIPFVVLIAISLLSFAVGYGARTFVSYRRRLRYRY